MMVEILKIGNKFGLRFPYDEVLVMRAKGLPSRSWSKSKALWTFPGTLANWEYINKWFPEATWCNDAKISYADALKRKQKREQVSENKEKSFDLDAEFRGVPFNLFPMKHQKMALFLGRNMESFAYLMDQGTGKTKVVLDDAAHNFRQGKITAILVIAPNSVKTNWVDPAGGEDEVSKHMAPDIPYGKGCWIANPKAFQRKALDEFTKNLGNDDVFKVLVVNVEGISFTKAFKFLQHFVSVERVMVVVDESTRIKNRAAKRTKAAIKLRQECPLARIMTGTPIIQSPLAAFAQFKFLDSDILGFDSYYAFQNHHALMGGYGNYQVLSFRNLEELAGKISSVSYRIMKEECLDLPKKTYQKRTLQMTPDQQKAYNNMRDDMLVNLEQVTEEEGRVSASTVLAQMTRLQQIASGGLPVLNDMGETEYVTSIKGNNVKVDEAMAIIEECQHKLVIWCNFRHEIQIMADALRKANVGFVEFHGGISEEDRVANRQAFQDPRSDVKIFIGQIQTGGVGLTLTQGRTVIYMSNSFSVENRVQSEDRSHRIGQDQGVQYIDLVCVDTIDEKVLKALKEKKKISDEILGDGWKEWI